MDKPSTLDEIYAQQQFWGDRVDRARKRRDDAEKTIDQCYKHLGVLTMVEQVADLLRPHFPDHTLRVLGPFGLANEVAIHVDDPSAITETQRFHKTVGSLQFRPSNDGQRRLVLIDWTRNTGRYPANSIGARNQFNYPDKELPGSIEELAGLLRASIKEESEV